MNKRIAINGIGRIGRQVFFKLLQEADFDIVLINDINTDIHNIVYTMNFDSIYKNSSTFSVKNNSIMHYKGETLVTHNELLSKDLIKTLKIDYIIESTGVNKSALHIKEFFKDGLVSKSFYTYSPGIEDITLVLGANEETYEPQKHNNISCSICDATAISPVLKIIDNNFDIKNGYVTTLHPFLNYQNVLDGPASSWSQPGEIYHHFALGRSSFNNLIPKPTTAIDITKKSVISLREKSLKCFSYRTPLEIVCSADITLNLKNIASIKKVVNLFKDFQDHQKYKIINSSYEPLVSRDYIASDFSANIDLRWLDVVDDYMIKLVLWYDNEFGYATRVVDQVKFVTGKLK